MGTAMNLAGPEEYAAVQKVLEDYCREGAAANVEELKKKVFHPMAVMNGNGQDGWVTGPIQNL